MIRLLATFETNPQRYKDMYNYNVLWHRYEFLDGTIKYNLPKDTLDPWYVYVTSIYCSGI